MDPVTLVIAGVTAAINIYLAEAKAVSERAANEGRALTQQEEEAIASGDVKALGELNAWANARPTGTDSGS